MCGDKCLDFHVYEGRGDRFLGESSKWVKFWNLGERVILAFAKLIPAGSFIFTDRFFTTPRVGAYLRDIYDVYLTGTLMKNTKGVDKDIMFKKSRKFGRGFFKWSFDHVAKVIQCCWLDRGPVLFMSTMISACIVGGLSRLTWSADKGTGVRTCNVLKWLANTVNHLLGSFAKIRFALIGTALKFGKR